MLSFKVHVSEKWTLKICVDFPPSQYYTHDSADRGKDKPETVKGEERWGEESEGDGKKISTLFQEVGKVDG